MPETATSTDSTTESTGTAAETSGGSTETQATATEATTETQTPALGDAGKKAIDAMKAERNQARDDLRALRTEFDAFKAKAEGKEAEHAAAQEAQRVKDEALAAANQRIVSAEIRAAAKGKVADDVLSDLHLFINPSDFEVGDDGGVDADAITAAVTDLISKKPSLAAQGGRFQGHGDGGARKETQQSIDQQIAEATKAGNHALAIALKRHKAQAASS